MPKKTLKVAGYGMKLFEDYKRLYQKWNPEEEEKDDEMYLVLALADAVRDMEQFLIKTGRGDAIGGD